MRIKNKCGDCAHWSNKRCGFMRYGAFRFAFSTCDRVDTLGKLRFKSKIDRI
jgi:hypothetical protein